MHVIGICAKFDVTAEQPTDPVEFAGTMVSKVGSQRRKLSSGHHPAKAQKRKHETFHLVPIPVSWNAGIG